MLQESSKTIWFGRDALGRRSLLVHWPSLEDFRLMFSSVSPPSAVEESLGMHTCLRLALFCSVYDLVEHLISYAIYINMFTDFGCENGPSDLKFWEELPCGVYSLSMSASETLVGKIRRHDWTDHLLEELIEWQRTYVEPKHEDLIDSSKLNSSEYRGK